MQDTVKLHVRVTKEIEVSRADAEALGAFAQGSEELDKVNLSRIITNIQVDTRPNRYADSYIPAPWLKEDLAAAGISFHIAGDIKI